MFKINLLPMIMITSICMASTEVFDSQEMNSDIQAISLEESSSTVWAETVQGFGMFTQKKDGCVSEHIRLHKNWQQEIVSVLKYIVKPTDTVLHLGGHIGFDDILLGNILKDQGKLFVFEPNPEVYEILLKNINHHGLNDVCKLYNVAASDEERQGVLSFEYGNTGHATIIPGWESMPETVSVPLVKLDDILEEVEKVDLIFMDIEGAEIQALKGAPKLLERSSNADILMEWDLEMMLAAPSNVKEFVSEMFQSGRFSYFVSQNDRQTIVRKTNTEDLLTAPHIDVLWTVKDFGEEMILDS